jgi:enoyl-CoA hydratase/carnithine racemase
MRHSEEMHLNSQLIKQVLESHRSAATTHRAGTSLVLLGADDVSGDQAERYEYVNRSVPHTDFGQFVDTLARRVASFDRRATQITRSCATWQ